MDATKVDMSVQQLICGRHRKNIKLIESSTGTAIYFPPMFSAMYRYCPPNGTRRDPTDVFISGETPQAIEMAKQKLHESMNRLRIYVKDVTLPSAKMDSILLTRLEKLRKILEANGTYIMFPPLASQRTMVRIQGGEGLPVERTVRELMSLVSIPQTLFIYALANLGCRLVNSIAPAGIPSLPTTDLFPLPRTSGLCSARSVLVLMPTSLSRR